MMQLLFQRTKLQKLTAIHNNKLKPKLKDHKLLIIEKYYKKKRKTIAVKYQRINLYKLWKTRPELVKTFFAEDSYNLKLVYDKLKAEKT